MIIMKNRARRRACERLLVVAAFASLFIPSPSFAASAPAAPVLLPQAKIFGLAETRRFRALPLRLQSTMPGPRPVLQPEPAPLHVDEEKDLLDRVLSLREDLRLLINQGIKDVRGERIALGLHFARAF